MACAASSGLVGASPGEGDCRYPCATCAHDSTCGTREGSHHVLDRKSFLSKSFGAIVSLLLFSSVSPSLSRFAVFFPVSGRKIKNPFHEGHSYIYIYDPCTSLQVRKPFHRTLLSLIICTLHSCAKRQSENPSTPGSRSQTAIRRLAVRKRRGTHLPIRFLRMRRPPS